MQRIILVSAAGTAAAVVLLVLGPRPAAAGGLGDKVRIGLVRSLTEDVPAGLLTYALRPFQALMAAQTGKTGEMATGDDTFALARKLDAGKVDIAVFHGHEFAWARAANPKLTALALCVNRTPEVRVHLVVPDGSKARSLDDLAGKAVAMPRLSRGHCKLFFERRCGKDGGAPEKFFGKVSRPLAPEDALDDVVEGELAAAVVDAVVLDSYRADKPGCARRLRSLVVSEPFPCGVVAYHADRLSAAEVRGFRSGLLGAKGTPKGRTALKMLRLTSFQKPPADHDKALEAIARAYPPPPRPQK